ncbi:MAG: phosphonate C-P lyase system protein PhnL [Rhodospirillaceae bacterium]|nr:phosphonate C-P lyase system protein PhnL [Rhodospirillaceae bacterium]|tara:strand:- start:977 stop:1687 length:711 start_codon:yes stop_codon:yes gene_type:complete
MIKSETDLIRIKNLEKTFILHNQGSLGLAVFSKISLNVKGGDCVVLTGASGTGKSTLLRSIYANYLIKSGKIEIKHDNGWVNLVGAPSHLILDVRRRTIGYVSQFLRVIPRISTFDLVSEPLIQQRLSLRSVKKAVSQLLTTLAIPESLWSLPPATFSGGEQQRVNIARTFIQDYPILLLDEPTASLDDKNRDAVIKLIISARERGTAIIGIFHDKFIHDAVATTTFNVELAKVTT